MVKGLDLFKEHFKEYTGQYILIGGTACDIQLRRKGLPFRTTSDLDIILIVEALDRAFVSHFYEFIKAGGYALAEVNSKKCFYRFQKPQAKSFPTMLELFAREPEALEGDYEYHIIDIQPDEEASSLSAILLEKDYYDFLMTQSTIHEGIRVANDYALVCLKMKAYMNNLELREHGVDIQSEKILKHRRDVVRLTIALDPGQTVSIPETLQSDLRRFLEMLEADQPGVEGIMNGLGFGKLAVLELTERLRHVFNLDQA